MTDHEEEEINVWDDVQPTSKKVDSMDEEKKDNVVLKDETKQEKPHSERKNKGPVKKRLRRAKADILFQMTKGMNKTAIPRKHISDIVREIGSRVTNGEVRKWRPDAISIIHEACEKELQNIFQDSERVLERAEKIELKPIDMQTAISIVKKPAFKDLIASYETNKLNKEKLKKKGVDVKNVVGRVRFTM
jgi:histone H3/H4